MATGQDLDELAMRVRTALDDQSIRDHELAKHLGLTVSGLSKAFHRRDGLRPRVEEIADFLSLRPEELLGDGEDNGRDRKPTTALRPPGEDKVALPPGCVLVRIAKESVRAFSKGRWALLGPAVMHPTTGSLVAYQGPDGYQLRTYNTDATGHKVVLLHQHASALPEVYSVNKTPPLRVVMVIGDRMKFTI